MTLGDKLSKKRRENNYTQEQLADILGVSRQAISKWESDITYPETDKLIRISELYNCSLDYLLKDTEDSEKTEGGRHTESEKTEDNEHSENEKTVSLFRIRLRERKSEKTVLGMPLWHIGKNAKGFVAVGLNAKGVIAVGLKAQGVVSLGLLSIGLFSFGTLSVGLLSFGMLALGILAAGCFAIGVFAAGAIALGIISAGAVAVGDFSLGALAIGKYFAFGDHAKAMIALGDSKAAGTVFQRLGELSEQDIAEAIQKLDSIVPNYLNWAKEIVKIFL